jgi:hypothetical protein
MISEQIILEGHLLDSLLLSKILDIVLREGGQFVLTEISVGENRNDLSRVRMEIQAEDAAHLNRIFHAIEPHGAKRETEPMA